MERRSVFFLAGCLAALWAVPAAGRVFEVGPGRAYANIGDVPLEGLASGDEVRIYRRPEAYREKWVISAQGTAAAPVVFRGVPGPGGELPVIDGEHAVTRRALSYWNEPRSVVKIGGSSVPSSAPPPRHIVVEGLDIRGARGPATFTDDSGNVQTYTANAAAVHIEIAEHVTIRNCILRDSGNGLFVTSSPEAVSRDIVIEGNHIHGNGNAGSIYEHNTYTAAIGIVYQFNRFGALAAGAGGNNLKDRSAGLVVRNNWIEGGNRQLDLVDAEDSGLIQADPSYGRTYVYGNVLIEPDGAGNRQIVHYGGDSGQTGQYRKGMLHFYHNTVVSTRADRTTLFRLSSMGEQCDARNNIFYTAHAGSGLEVLNDEGTVTLSHNWFKAGWVDSFYAYSGAVYDDGTQTAGASAGFVDAAGQDFVLDAVSECIDRAGPVHPEAAGYPAEREYVRHRDSRVRPASGTADDLGAFERPLWDFNADRSADLEDFALLCGQWLADGCLPANGWCGQADLDRSGTTDLDDLMRWADYWLVRF